MVSDVHQLIQTLHNQPEQLVLVAAGAGTQALSDLLGVAGASRTLLEAIVPYSAAAFDDFLGQTPKKYVRPDTARLLAGRALTRAMKLAEEIPPLLGVACSATIVTDRPKRGEHRAHLVTWQPARQIWYGLHLKKGVRDRMEEETLVSRQLLNLIAEATGMPYRLPLPLRPEDRLETETRDFAAMARQLAQREISYFGMHDHGRIRTTDAHPQTLLPGAFNPLHKGHVRLAQAAAQILGRPVAFELSAVNVDKPPLEESVVLARLAQFAGRWPTYASNAPTFIAKARLYPGATFVVGYDTAVRILQPRYYDNSREKMQAALKEIRDRGARFLVGGRVDEDGHFRQISDLEIPADFAPLFSGIPESRFRKDVSSTELRQRAEN